MGLAIVAIPEENDRVWKVSSEKVPHLTLLFLGDAESADLQTIMQFVEHAVTLSEHGPFYLDVDHRGTLGEAEADVVFFNKRSWNLKWIKQFRAQLLQNQAIRTAYDSAEQFGALQEWLPHVTLGYPQTPAKPLESDDHPLYSVCFDRIAVWEGEYEGPDFRLEWPDRELEGDLAIAYSDTQKAALAHYGVKGMRWGQKKTETVTVGGKTKQVTPKKAAKLDAKFEKNVGSLGTFVALHNAAAEHANSKIPEINASFEKKHPKEMNDGTLWNASHPVTREYHKAHNEAIIEGLNKAAESMGTNPSGTRRVKIVTENHDSVTEFGWAARTEKVKHAASDSDDSDIVFVANLDSEGRITSLKLKTEDSMAQTADLGEEFVEHHGVKGMKWGVRTKSSGGGLSDGLKKLGRGIGTAVEVGGNIQFENMARDGRAREEIETRATEAFHRSDLPKINSKPEYAKARKLTNRLRHPKDPLTKQYRNEVKSTYVNRLEKAANSMTNPSGNRQYTIRERGWELPAQGGDLPRSKWAWEVSTRDVKHADATAKPFFMELVLDEDGFITELKPIEATATHGEVFVEGLVHGAADLGEAFILEHYGIKGMRWGFRRSSPEAVAPTASSKVPHGTKRKTKIETDGGENHPAHEDAIKVAQARTKLKKSGPAALSNQELREVANRIQLENQVTLLSSSKGKQFVKRQLQNEGQNLAREGIKRGAKKGAQRVGSAVLL